MLKDKDHKTGINKEINYSSNIQKNIIKESTSINDKIINDFNPAANYEKNEFKEKRKIENNNIIFDIPINHLSQNLNKINDFTNIPNEEKDTKSKIIFDMPINTIRNDIKENEKKKGEDTDNTSKDYFQDFVDDYIFDDYEENEENEEKEEKEEGKPIFNIPIGIIKKESKN